MTTRAASLLLCLTMVPACAGDADEGSGEIPGGVVPEELADHVDDALGDLADGDATIDGLEYHIYELGEVTLDGEVTPESCDAVDTRLAETCNQLYAEDPTQSCWYLTTFYWAHQTPRCAVRIVVSHYQTEPEQQVELPSIYAMDFTGAPSSDPAPTCGNTILDEGEGCDDGNVEAWDGCDSTCQQEEFTGCEAVIEGYYADAGIAHVDRTTWEGPRSHIMVNGAEAMTTVDESTCNAAIALGTDVCSELQRQMPFVSWCSPSGQFHDEDNCSVRLDVGFSSLDPDGGVFTTALPGVLAFTIH